MASTSSTDWKRPSVFAITSKVDEVKPILMEDDLQFTDLPAGHFHAANSGDRE